VGTGEQIRMAAEAKPPPPPQKTNKI
jgi:hypothetical protein